MGEERQENEKKENSILIPILVICAISFSGFLLTFLLCAVTGTAFGLKLWPMILCIDCFVFTTIGFFSTEGKTEKIYGLCSIVSAACFVVQLALIF